MCTFIDAVLTRSEPKYSDKDVTKWRHHHHKPHVEKRGTKWSWPTLRWYTFQN